MKYLLIHQKSKLENKIKILKIRKVRKFVNVLGPFLANSANPVGAAEADEAAEEVPANCEKSTAVLSMPSCEAPLTPDEDGDTEAETEAAKLENVGVLDETDEACALSA